MKKVTDFMINKRHSILAVFLFLTLLSCFLATKVKTNGDLTKYLPEDSMTRIGTEIMNEEFSDEENYSSLNLMFKKLKSQEKEKILEDLKSIKGVSKVQYDESDSYNKDDYTLYVINVDAHSNSKTSKNVYEEILDNYKDYEIYTSGSIKSSNTEILPSWIMITAIGCALVILIIMCDSFLEPFLFLISIFIAVILNAGTNIIFESVSEVTNAISAILVMALSMDYSIMLINRFRSEREKEPNNVEAMKNALYNSFKSISSSSLTTIVGLLSLVFMSFTIGKDLGLVLAKGVLLCLISVFLVLPTLILTFDKLLTKTEKKVFNIKLNGLGEFSYKFKLPITFIFIFLIIGSTLLKGNLSILYTSVENSKIDEVFGQNNQIALIYANDFEENFSKYINTLEENSQITNVQGYGNTLNLPLAYDELNNKLASFSSKVDIEDYLLKILYYHYYNEEENNTLTLSDFYEFLMTEVNNNENMKSLVGENLSSLKSLSYFIEPYEIESLRTSEELSNILGIESDKVNDLLVYYNSQNNSLELTLKEFITFIKEDVLTNQKYKDLFSEKILENLEQIDTFTNKDFILTNKTSEELSIILNIPKETIDLILLLKYSSIENNKEYTLNEIITKVIFIKENTNLLDGVDTSNYESLSIFTNKDLVNVPLDKDTLSTYFTPELTNYIYAFNSLTDTSTLSIKDFLDVSSLIIESNPENLPNEIVEKITFLKLIVDDTLKDNPSTFTSLSLSEFLNIDSKETMKLYALIDYVNGNTESWTMNIYDLVNLILENTSNIEEDTMQTLTTIETVMTLVLNEEKLNSKDISKLLDVDAHSISLLYGLYVTNYINNEVSLYTLIDFILNDVINTEAFRESFIVEQKTYLKNIKWVMENSLNYVKYTKENMYRTLSNFTSNITSSDIDLLYMYYGSVNNYDASWNLTIEKFVGYLSDNIINDTRFNNFISEEMKTKILESKEIIRKSKSLLVGENYSRLILNTKYDLESKEVYNFIESTIKDLKDNKEFYIVGDSVMAYEMDKTFYNEFNWIGILTMIFLALVVAITFKSLIIPLVLVLLIECAVYLTMAILSITAGSVYFIAILVVQSILMGATIDYAIVYTSYYKEHRLTLNVKEAIIASYNSSIHTILTSSSILIIVTFILGIFAKDITSKICITISEGTLCSSILILILLPGTLASLDKFIIKNKH